MVHYTQLITKIKFAAVLPDTPNLTHPIILNLLHCICFLVISSMPFTFVSNYLDLCVVKEEGIAENLN